MQLARHLDPRDSRIRKQQQRFAKLASPVVFAYLFLVPLEISAGLRLQSSGGVEQLSRLVRAERQLAELRQALTQSSSNADLSARFQALGGPKASPAEETLPLPVLKAQAALALDQAQAQIQRERKSLPARNPLGLLPALIRSTIFCLALAFGFAIFARTSDSELSLLDAWQNSLERRRQRRTSRSGRQADEAAYIRQLSREDNKTSRD